MKRIWFLVLVSLALITTLVWFALFSYSEDNLKIIACDVGQGDAFLVSRKDFQILIDGGPNNRVLQCLADNMPFWDKVVEVVVLSHPQKDHFMGLIEVFKRYEIKYFFTTPLDSGSYDWEVLNELVGGSHTKVLNPVRGNKYRLGMIYLDVLYPTEEFLRANLIFKNSNLTLEQFDNTTNFLGAYTSKIDPNEFSVVLIMSYKDFDALFTGDISPVISDKLAQELKQNYNERIEYIKVPHHGSKNGLSVDLIDAVNPEVAVISAGKGNSYGHPHKEILDMLQSTNIQVLRTDQLGNIKVVTDGNTWLVE